MTNKNKALITFLSIGTVLTAPIALAVSCGQKQAPIKGGNDHNGKPGKDPKKDTGKGDNTDPTKKPDITPPKHIDKHYQEWIIDKDKVNIVALGDSVASGYTQLDKQDHRGFLHDDGTISGISYSSYLAREFQKKNKLEDFSNFAIAGATTKTLRKQFDKSYVLNDVGKHTLWATNIKVNTQPGERERFTHLIDKVKKANLITISIGANDILSTIKLGGLSINQIMSQGLGSFSVQGGINTFVSYDHNELKLAEQDAKNNLKETIKDIRKINPDVQISIVGYPMPVTQLAYLLKIPENNNGKSIAKWLLNTVDKIGLSAAEMDERIDFIDGYLPKTWDKEALSLAPELIDIHPGPRGYRYMAATILANFMDDSNFLNLDNNNPFTPSLLEHLRLNGDYTKSIERLSNLQNPLLEEGKHLQSLKKPYKLIHYTAILLPKIVKAFMPTNIFKTPATPVLDAYEAYPSSPLLQLVKLKPFVEQVLISGESGLESDNRLVNEGVERDTLFILATLYNSLDELLGMGSQLKSMILNEPLRNPNLSKMRALVIWNWIKKITDVHERAEIIKLGPSTDYLKI